MTLRTPEGQVKAKIKKVLESFGDDCYYFMPVQMGYGKRTVDFLICLHGNFIAIEAKRKGAKARKIQELIISKILRAGGFAIIVDNAEELTSKLNLWVFGSDVARP